MKTYHFNTVVQDDGSVQLSGLPPKTPVEIVVWESADLSDEMEQWLHDVRTRHPFARMSKEEILERLRQTREAVWAERHEDKP
jgi:hypothetical protein